MRIALASIHPRPLSGQIEGLVGLAQALEMRGNCVNVFSAFPESELLSRTRIKLADKEGGLSLGEPFRMLRVLGDLVHASREVDVIHLNLPTPAFSMVGDILQSMVRVPVIVGFEAHLANVEDLLRLDRLLKAPQFYLPRLLVNNSLIASIKLGRAARYVVSSLYQKLELIQLGIRPERIHHVPNLLPRDKLERQAVPANRGDFPAGRLITYVGHYNHVKGVDVLLKAFKQLAPRWRDLKLVLAWSGLGARREVDALVERIGEDRVVELGRTNVPELMRASEMVVLPYRLTIGQAAYPATLLEALAANVPVVTSDLPLLRELTRSKTAVLAEPENPPALADAMECVLTQPLLVEQMLRAQRQWVQEIEPNRIVKQYERIYQNAASQTRVLLPARDR